MKKMKKVMALLLSLVMVLAMSVVAFADEGGSGLYTITINNQKENTGHTYESVPDFYWVLWLRVYYLILNGVMVLLKQDRIILVMLLPGCNINKDADAEAICKRDS